MTDDEPTVSVDGETVSITPYGFDDRGRLHFEVAGLADRSVFPTDRGRVADGAVWVVTPDTTFRDSENWVWERIGEVAHD